MEWWRRRDGWSVFFKTGRTMPSPSAQTAGKGCGACYSSQRADESWGRLASHYRSQPVHESLQGRPEVGPLPTPRRCLGIRGCFRVHRCELRFHSALADRRDHFTNRTRVQKLSAARTTCLVQSFVSRPLHADAQAGSELSAGFREAARGAPTHEHMNMTLLWLPTHPMCKVVQGPTGIKRLERNYRRSQLYAMQRFYEELPLGMPRSASTPLSKPGRPRNRLAVYTEPRPI